MTERRVIHAQSRTAIVAMAEFLRDAGLGSSKFETALKSPGTGTTELADYVMHVNTTRPTTHLYSSASAYRNIAANAMFSEADNNNTWCEVIVTNAHTVHGGRGDHRHVLADGEATIMFPARPGMYAQFRYVVPSTSLAERNPDKVGTKRSATSVKALPNQAALKASA